MASRNKGQDFHRFPSGEQCEYCPARRWYAESGLRYCENGHRIEGFVEFDIDDENLGRKGKIARKAREVREKATRHLTGNAARELYLECLQLVLRQQTWWLVQEQKFPPELETVVRDLWDLRIRNFAGLGSAMDETIDAESETELGPGSGTNLFSSWATDVFNTTARSSGSRPRSWASEPGLDWNLPRVSDCLALCYLACLSLSLPVRVGHVYNWSKSDELLFLGAFDAIPVEMTDRLPGPYHRALKVKFPCFHGGELHHAVLELILEYHLNYGMVFPPPNTPLLIFHYIRELALPVEVYVHVRAITKLLRFKFSFDMQRKRFLLLDHPDVLLIACIVFSAKLLYPFDGEERRPANDRDPSSLQIDWDRWRVLMSDAQTKGLQRQDILKLGPEDAWTMTDRHIDDYLDWYEGTQIRSGTETQELSELFPLPARRHRHTMPKLTEDEIDERLMTAVSYTNVVTPVHGEWVKGAGEDHAVYRTIEELPRNAKAFYGKAANLSGLSTGKMVKAVHTLELKVHQWCIQQRKASDEEDITEYLLIRKHSPINSASSSKRPDKRQRRVYNDHRKEEEPREK